VIAGVHLERNVQEAVASCGEYLRTALLEPPSKAPTYHSLPRKNSLSLPKACLNASSPPKCMCCCSGGTFASDAASASAATAPATGATHQAS
jgi:hypothetical protein